MDICFITDSNYVIGVLTAIKSIELNAAASCVIRIHVLVNGLNDYEKKCILDLRNKNTEILLIDIEDKIPDIDCSHIYVSKTALAKFILPDLFKDLDKILYLDDDILALDDITEFEKFDISGVYAAVVKDFIASDFGKSIGADKYFNSGVMLLNLKRMREDNVSEKLLEYKKNETEHVYMDQNAFNIILADNVLYMPLVFNYLTPIEEIDDRKSVADFYNVAESVPANIQKSVVILHFAGSRKFWTDVLNKYLNIYLPYLFSLPYSKIKNNTINKLFKQNSMRFIKYCLKQIPLVNRVISIYENII